MNEEFESPLMLCMNSLSFEGAPGPPHQDSSEIVNKRKVELVDVMLNNKYSEEAENEAAAAADEK